MFASCEFFSTYLRRAYARLLALLTFRRLGFCLDDCPNEVLSISKMGKWTLGEVNRVSVVEYSAIYLSLDFAIACLFRCRLCLPASAFTAFVFLARSCRQLLLICFDCFFFTYHSCCLIANWLCQDWVTSLLFTIVPYTFLPVFYIILRDFCTVVIFFIFRSFAWLSLVLMFSWVFAVLLSRPFLRSRDHDRDLWVQVSRPRSLGLGLETKTETLALNSRHEVRDLGKMKKFYPTQCYIVLISHLWS